MPVADYGWLKAAGGANAVTLMGSLPRISARRSLEKFPAPHAFLVPDADEVARWKSVFGDRRHRHLLAQRQVAAAIAPCNMRRWRPGRDFLRDIDRPAVVSVQYDATPDEIAELERLSGRKIIVPQGIDQKNELDRACRPAGGAGCGGQRADRRVLAGGRRRVRRPTRCCTTPAGPRWARRYEPFAPACRCVMPQQRGDWADVFAQAQAKLYAPL